MKIDWQLIKFPFADPSWVSKTLIGGLLVLVGGFLPIPFFFLLWPLQGYGVRIMRAAMRGEEASLPEWDNWGELFSDGLRVWVVSFVYTLPLTILISCAYCALFLPVLAPIIGAASEDPAVFGAFFLTTTFVSYAVFFVAFGVVALVSIPIMFLTIVAITRMVALGSLGAAFQFGEVWALARRGFGNFMLAVIVLTGALSVISFIATVPAYTVILSCLYPIALLVITFYAQALSGALFGQAYYHTEIGSAERVGMTQRAEASPASAGKARRASAKK